MSDERRFFGTDGIRGRVGEHPITAEFVLKLGWAAGQVLAGGRGGLVVIGKDTRISGYMFESALEAGLSSAGVDIHLLGPMPTPGIAYLTRTLHADAGIVISASHNPFQDNGIKFFSAQGTKLADGVELEIEAQMEKEMRTVESARLGKAKKIADASGRYIEFCKSTIPFSSNLRGMKIVVDCAHGATYHVAPSVFHELGAEVITIGTSPNGTNINAGVGATEPKALQRMVLEHAADVGVALDGDGDRLIFVDHQGQVVDGDEILLIIAESRRREGRAEPAIVGTVMSNLGLEEALRQRGMELKRANVGDRYVLELLQKHGLNLGGETSGHILCLDRLPTGDGIVAALQVLIAAQKAGRPIAELKRDMTKFPQVMVNVRMRSRVDVTAMPAVQEAVADVENELGESGRVLLRLSGTEPLVRVMVEGRDHGLVTELANRIAAAVSDALEAV